ncbi:MAG: recombinase family protein [Chloroflexota bacterium]|nr:recombinase family protein [Chloroflexota bacterium]
MIATTHAQRRAAIYCRVSTSKQVEGTSLDTQEQFCREYAERQGYAVEPDLVVREVYTGEELWDRPKLARLRDEVRRGTVDVIISYAVDRLSRDPVHLLVVLSEAEHVGAGVEFVTEPFDSTPEGQLIQFVRGYAAKVEHAKIRERSLRGKRARVENGKIHNAGSELYGYRRDKERGVRLIHEPEATIVRRIFTEAADGTSIRSIAATLNRECVPSPAAGKREFRPEGGKSPRWGKTALHRILTNPEYKGEAVVWRLQSTKGKTGRRHVERDPSGWVRLPDGVTPAIVPTALWEAVAKRRSTNTGERTRNETRPYLLRGVAYCGACGSRLTPEREKGTYLVYRCGSRYKIAGRCGGKRVPGDKLEAWVWERIERVLWDKEIIAAEVERQRRDGPDPALVADLESTVRVVDDLTRQQERLVRRLAEATDDFPWEILEREVARIEGQRKQSQARARELAQRIADQEAKIIRLDSLEAYCERVRDNLTDLDFDRRRDAVEALVERVVASGVNAAEWRLELAIRGLPDGVLPLTSAGCDRRRRRPRARA